MKKISDFLSKDLELSKKDPEDILNTRDPKRAVKMLVKGGGPWKKHKVLAYTMAGVGVGTALLHPDTADAIQHAAKALHYYGTGYQPEMAAHYAKAAASTLGAGLTAGAKAVFAPATTTAGALLNVAHTEMDDYFKKRKAVKKGMSLGFSRIKTTPNRKLRSESLTENTLHHIPRYMWHPDFSYPAHNRGRITHLGEFGDDGVEINFDRISGDPEEEGYDPDHPTYDVSFYVNGSAYRGEAGSTLGGPGLGLLGYVAGKIHTFVKAHAPGKITLGAEDDRDVLPLKDKMYGAFAANFAKKVGGKYLGKNSIHQHEIAFDYSSAQKNREAGQMEFPFMKESISYRRLQEALATMVDREHAKDRLPGRKYHTAVEIYKSDRAPLKKPRYEHPGDENSNIHNEPKDKRPKRQHVSTGRAPGK